MPQFFKNIGLGIFVNGAKENKMQNINKHKLA